MCIKGKIWPPFETKTESCFSRKSPNWFIRRIAEVHNAGFYFTFTVAEVHNAGFYLTFTVAMVTKLADKIGLK